MNQGRHFGTRLREARLSAGLSQSELEELSGIPKARLSRYENGHVEPSIQTLNRLARALNVSEASLLGDERAAMEEFFNVLGERGVTIASKDEARKLLGEAIGSYDWDARKATWREAWIAHILRREAEALIQPEVHDHSSTSRAGKAGVESKSASENPNR